MLGPAGPRSFPGCIEGLAAGESYSVHVVFESRNGNLRWTSSSCFGVLGEQARSLHPGETLSSDRTCSLRDLVDGQKDFLFETNIYN